MIKFNRLTVAFTVLAILIILLIYRYIMANKVLKAIPVRIPTPTQEETVKAILKQWQAIGDADRRKLAYILATAWHEAGLRYDRTEVKGSESSEVWQKYQSRYWNTGYYGRGLAQLTHRSNYEKYGRILGIDLAGNPELAREKDNSAFILVHGMITGGFTGRALDRYINSTTKDYYNARRTVNGIVPDVARKIAATAERIEAALNEPA